jgi:hypothetical protein
MVRYNYSDLQESKRVMKNWIDPDDEIIRGRKKKVEVKPRPKKANHKHEYIDSSCVKCGKIK